MKTIKPKKISIIGQEKHTEKIPQETTKQIKKNKTTVAICIPTYNQVSSQWFIEFWRFIKGNAGKYLLHVLIHEQQPTSVSRNSLSKQALALNPDYIFWLDSDNIAPDTTIDVLINTMEETGADLVTALYFGKDVPHYPVIKEYKSGGFYRFDNPATGQKFQISGCGFGCCLMKANVLHKLEEPWFKFSHEKWGKEDIVMSEDLYFCRKMMKAGMKMVCDATIISDHIGSSVRVAEYMTYGPLRQALMEDREECLKDLQEFENRSRSEIDNDVRVGNVIMKEEWNEKLPNTDEEIKIFYKETKNYVYDQVMWHFGSRRRFDVELIVACNRSKDKFKREKPKLLDFGCGIGQNAMMLARAGYDVTLADLDSHTLKFAEHRFKKHNIPYKVWKTDVEDMPPEDKYDIILAFDVFEHLPAEEMEKLVDKLVKLKHPETEVVQTTTFGKTEVYPMHMDMEPKHEEALNKLLKKVEPEKDGNTSL
jgi:ubiquinone/menaquinone biosynthesis C-methylase UbiE